MALRSCRLGGSGLAPKLGTVFEDGSNDHRQLPGDCDMRFLQADPLDQPEPPGLESGEPGYPGQKNVGRFVEERSDHPVAAFGDPTLVVNLSRLITSWRQSEINAGNARVGEPPGVVDSAHRLQRRNGADTGNGQKTAARVHLSRHSNQAFVQPLELGADCRSSP